MAGSAVLTDRQQAQGKHGKECRGAHSKVVDRIDTALLAAPFRLLGCSHSAFRTRRRFYQSELFGMPAPFKPSEKSELHSDALIATHSQLHSVERRPSSAPLALNAVTAPTPARRRGHLWPAADHRGRAAPVVGRRVPVPRDAAAMPGTPLRCTADAF